MVEMMTSPLTARGVYIAKDCTVTKTIFAYHVHVTITVQPQKYRTVPIHGHALTQVWDAGRLVLSGTRSLCDAAATIISWRG